MFFFYLVIMALFCLALYKILFVIDIELDVTTDLDLKYNEKDIRLCLMFSIRMHIK